MNGARLGPKDLRTLLGEWETDGQSAYHALADRIRLLIIDGRIPTRTRLPAERELADELERSRTTIVSAYRELKDTGHLVSQRGSGSVAALPHAHERPGPLPQPAVVDFSRAAPAAIGGLETVIQRATADLSQVLSKSGFDLIGSLPLRERIADHYSRRGLPTHPGQVMITLGAQHAIALLGRTLVRRADRVLVESPTYPHALDAFRMNGGRLVTVPVTAGGWDGERLRDAFERARPALAYLIPDFQNPTGASMPPRERDDVIRDARRAGTVLVIDETTADLDIDRGWTDVPFAARADGHRTVTIGSLGKSVWGGLRIGWIRADDDVIGALHAARAAGDLGTPELEQLVAAEVFDDYDALVQRRTAQLRHHRDVLVRELNERLPHWDVPVPDGGASLWVGLGAPISSALALFGLTRGVSIIAGPKFGIDGAFERFVRLPFTGRVDELTRGVHLLEDTARSLPALPAGRTPHLAEVV
ncbi:MocR-like transcription factor YczR [Jiangella alkaliphila]|uniref:DNA-binding transcriptional regulator, MocR family, contains an aminotransferase domain n=1 Tax=Jiangella alkaliphila TaxID=419479 RepID=A0A1H2L294_9ACTN|nr:PLP-dependent aminotransferase family protein [Jiangella alkaliphila]SDU74914.1 DNA-binding transcriptional regulator, MocR family, contains an aminotransferase domain [Jiangella alkaliphila]